MESASARRSGLSRKMDFGIEEVDGRTSIPFLGSFHIKDTPKCWNRQPTIYLWIEKET
jgi:hypothetical protein